MPPGAPQTETGPATISRELEADSAPCLAVGGALGALGAILATFLVGVATGWAWSYQRGKKLKDIYTTTKVKRNIHTIQHIM